GLLGLRATPSHVTLPVADGLNLSHRQGCCGSESVIRRCWLNVRFTRKRTRLADFMSKFTGSLRILVWCWPGRRRPGPLTSFKNVNRNHVTNRTTNISPAPRDFVSQTQFWHGLLREAGPPSVHHPGGWPSQANAHPPPRAR